MKKLILLYILIPFFSYSQNSMNMSLLGTYDYPTTQGNDIWGWVDGSNNEYALVGLRSGFSVVNVTNPSSPLEEFFISDVNSTWRDIKTWGNYAYVTTEASAGLLIVDLTDMTGNTYSHVTQFTNNNGGSVSFTSAHDIYIDENGIAYIFGAGGPGPQSDGAIFLDVDANPTNPVYLGEWSDEYIHDGMVRGDTMYAGCIYAGKVFIVDVSDKTNPITIGSHSTPNNFTHNAWVSTNGNYVFTTDEQSGAYLTAFDVSNPSNIFEVDRIRSNPGSNSIPHNTFVDGNFLITSYYRDGTTVHDITYPNNMIQVAYYDSYSGSGNGFDGCWGTYPYLPSGNIISSDINSGAGGKGVLNIYERAFQQACYLSGNVTNGNSGFPVSNVTIQIVNTTFNTTTNLLGDYTTSTINAGLYQVTFSATGYISVTLNATLANGVMTILDAILFPGTALLGCTDSTAINYNPNATIDDSSCIYPAGCTNPLAYNYNPSANTSIAFGGIPSNFVGTGSYYSGNRHLIFDAYVESNIVSALVYAQNSNTITFELRDNSSTVIDDTAITVVSGTQRLYFDFDVPVGNGYELGITGNNSGLYRNNGGVSYPYDIGGLINITGSSATPSYYYFYYDIEVEAVCTGIISPVYGCTDPTATNYNPLATVDDGSCQAILFGCMDPLATNYNPNANMHDQSLCSYFCGAITGVNLTDIIHDRATFNWDDMNSTCAVDQIRIRYRVGTNAWNTKTMGDPVGNNAPCLNTSKRVLNLSASTQYEYDFKIWYQDGTIVNWHAGGTFTTAAACDNATNVTATPVNSTKTSFCWTAPSSPYSFVRLQYRENVPGSSFSNIGGFGVFSPTLCKDKNGLTPGTQYRVMYRTWCNATGGPYRSPVWDGPVIWDQPTSIRVEGGTAITNLEIYPNPSRDIFNITFTSNEKQDLEISIINVIGENIFIESKQQFVGEYTKQIDLKENPKAIYFLEIETDDGVINKKLILQ